MSIEYFITVFICLSPGTGVVHHDEPDVFFASCDDEGVRLRVAAHAVPVREQRLRSQLTRLPVTVYG